MHLKEVDQNAKLVATITALNVPKHLMTGPATGYKKDDDDQDDPMNNFNNNANRFIM